MRLGLSGQGVRAPGPERPGVWRLGLGGQGCGVRLGLSG